MEPDVARRLDDARRLFKLGLLRRGREVVDETVARYPEVRERALAIVPAPVARKRLDGPLSDAVNAYFRDGTPLKTDAPIADVLAAVRRGSRGTDAPVAGLHDRKTYLLRVPPECDPEAPMRLLVSLHGSSSTARHAHAAWARSLEADRDFIVAFPEGSDVGWGHGTACHERIFSAIRDVCARHTIDPDAISIDGASMGGHGAFSMAMHHPGRWSAIAPRVASARAINMHIKGGVPDLSPAPPLLENLWATPVYFIAGVQDGNSPIAEARLTKSSLERAGAPLVWRERDGGHAWYRDEDPDVLDFLRTHRRDPYPRRVRLVSTEPAVSRSGWIEILSSTREARIEITHLDLLQKPIETRRVYDKPAEVDADADRAKNRVTIRTTGVRELRVWLADELLDIDKPVEIALNGAKAFEVNVARSLQAALEDCRKRGERGAPFIASVKVAVK